MRRMSTPALMLGIVLVGMSPPSLAAGETITVPFAACGGVQTAGTYSGLVQVTVTGYGIVTPGNPGHDGFYGLTVADPTVAKDPCPDCFRFARVSEGGCTCFVECSEDHAVSSILVGPYPAFDPGHSYSVTLDLGTAPPDRLSFGIADCGCGDNSGQFVVTIDPAPPTTTTTTTTTTLPPDADGDGVLDASESCFCLGTASGAPVTAKGC